MKLPLFFVSAAALFALGCAPDASKVCGHLTEVYKGHVDPPRFLAEKSRCVEHFEERKGRHGVNSYRREAECILASRRVFDARECSAHEDHRYR